MGDANTNSVSMPDLCAICGSESPTATFEQRVKIAKPPKNAYGNKRFESLTLPVCDTCLKKHTRACTILQSVYSVTVILGAIMGFYTLYMLGQLPNLVVLAPYVFIVGGLFSITLIAFYWERRLEHKYVKRENAGNLYFKHTGFAKIYNTLNGANSGS